MVQLGFQPNFDVRTNPDGLVRVISILQMPNMSYFGVMKKSLVIIAVALATSTGVYAGISPKATSPGDLLTGSTTITDLTDDGLGLGSQGYSSQISTLSLGGNFTLNNVTTVNDGNSSSQPAPHMNRPGGSYLPLNIPTNPPSVPDGGLTVTLLALGMTALVLLSKNASPVRSGK
jgi:hypothetical protein